MQPRGCALLLIAAIATTPVVVHADDAASGDVDYFANQPDPTEVKVRRSKSRTTQQRLQIGALLGGSAIAAGIGVWYHLDSRDAANDVSSNGDLTGETWTPDRQATYDRIDSSGIKAAVGYSLSGVLAVGALVVAWMTRPGDEEVSLRPSSRTATPVVTPVPGGAMVGGGWAW